MTYTLSHAQVAGIAVLAVWELIWKGMALWRAGKNRDPVWFVIILVLNTVGILPIIYLLTHKEPPGDGNRDS